MNFTGTDKAKVFGSEVRMLLIDFFSGGPARQVDAMRALGIDRAVISANTRALVEVGVLVAGEERTYTVDRARLDDVLAPLEKASRAAPTAVPTPEPVSAAAIAFENVAAVQLIHHYAENPGRQVDAVRALGVERAVVSLNVRALLDTGVLVRGPERTYQVDRSRFRELVRALEEFGPQE
ncbi:MAG: hypothetical protein M3467_03335 [Actinomycetota bacterium]|nr:hypothetical protein [Actinomycetota bacterium]